MSTYFVSLPSTGISAEVEAPTTRSARTTYLDYLTRNGIIPWSGRNRLREGILTDKIESGQMEVDIQLSYGLEGAGQKPSSVYSPDESIEIGRPNAISNLQVSQDPVSQVSVPIIGEEFKDPSSSKSLTGLSGPLPRRDRISSKLKDLGVGTSKIGQFSKRTLGRGKI